MRPPAREWPTAGGMFSLLKSADGQTEATFLPRHLALADAMCAQKGDPIFTVASPFVCVGNERSPDICLPDLVQQVSYYYFYHTGDRHVEKVSQKFRLLAVVKVNLAWVSGLR